MSNPSTIESTVQTELRRQALQSSLDEARSAAERNRLGQFATPNALAMEIAEYVSSLLQPHAADLRFADPAIGTGSFFSAAVQVFGAERLTRAYGVELDPRFCTAARDLWAAHGLEVVEGDFTRIVGASRCPPSPTLILANPPYVRHHHLSREDKERLRALCAEQTRVKVNGLAGLYVYFLLLATAWMEEGGYAAWLIPSEFMDVNYGNALRQFLVEQVTLLRVHRFDPADVQFGDALVSSTVLVFRKSSPSDDHEVEFTYGGSLADARASEAVQVAQLRTSRKWTAYPSHASNNRYGSNSGAGLVLGDIFTIRRGIATGCNKLFVLERQKAKRLSLPAGFLRPILPNPRHLKATIIERGEDGYPLLDPQLCMIDCELDECTLAEQYPSLWKYLVASSDKSVRGRYLLRKRTPWYKQEYREPAPILCTYMGRGCSDKPPFRFILNRSNAIATNLFLMLYPKGPLREMLRVYPNRIDSVFLLLGNLTNRELLGEGRVYGGGLNKIEPRELGRVSAEAMLERWPELRKATLLQANLFD